MALLYVRRREAERERERVLATEDNTQKTIEELDAALDAAINEINKLGSLVQVEIDEKYKAMLFLYNLVEDKQKEIAETTDSKVINKKVEQYIKTHGAKLRLVNENRDTDVRGVISVTDDVVDTVDVPRVVAGIEGATGGKVSEIVPMVEEERRIEKQGVNLSAKPVQTPKFTNPKHKHIWELCEGGKSIPEIAKELGMGQGEVKLILNLLDRA